MKSKMCFNDRMIGMGIKAVWIRLAIGLILTGVVGLGWAQDEDDADAGFKAIFNGESLEGWVGDENFWRVEDGAIVGETTPEKSISSNIFLVWDQGEVDDFELRLKFRISGTERANSGIQYRSQQGEDGHLAGYQADIDRSGQYIGITYDERTGRGILCQRGERVTIDEKGKRTAERVTPADELLNAVDMDGWNDYVIRAEGHRLTQYLNGQLVADVTDYQEGHFDRKGKLGLQLHVGPPMKIEFKDLQLKRLPLADGDKKVVFVAGTPSHGWGAHEHNAGCLLLAKCLDQAAAEIGLPIVSTVYRNGWPADPTAFDNADTVVSYCDGGGRHYLHEHGEVFEEIMRKGVGLACIHYGVEVPKGLSGQRFLNWIGGYFETDWSVNPHWKAEFTELPDHDVMNGVEPFSMQDEWYYHMRFSPQMMRVTPLLTALPPADTLSRKDGPHSGNPAVREAVLERNEPQHLAWVFERGDGVGRGFGFTGGHFHRNWQSDPFRKVVLNAIAWTAHVEIPETGIPSPTPSEAEMDANQDYPKPSK